MALQEFALKHRLRVRWAEVDRQGIVFNGHYLAFFDVAITEYWRAIGYPYPDALLEHDCDMFVVKATVEYHAPARYDDLLDVCARVARLGNSSMQFVLEIYRGEEHLISGEVIYVNAGAVDRRPKTVPAFLREAIGRFEVTGPVSK